MVAQVLQCAPPQGDWLQNPSLNQTIALPLYAPLPELVSGTTYIFRVSCIWLRVSQNLAAVNLEILLTTQGSFQIPLHTFSFPPPNPCAVSLESLPSKLLAWEPIAPRQRRQAYLQLMDYLSCSLSIIVLTGWCGWKKSSARRRFFLLFLYFWFVFWLTLVPMAWQDSTYIIPCVFFTNALERFPVLHT